MSLNIKIILLIILGITLSDCSQNKDKKKPIHSPQTTINPSCERLNQPGTGALFFSNPTTPAMRTALQAERTTFLQGTPYQNYPLGFGSVHQVTGSFNLQNADPERPPLLALYANSAGITEYGDSLFLVRFPRPNVGGSSSSFLNSLPVSVQDELRHHPIQTIDLFFAPQLNTAITAAATATGAGVVAPTGPFELLSHFWRFPGVDPASILSGTPPVQGDTCLGIYEPQNHPASFLQTGEQAVPLNSLKKFYLIYHDRAISPNNAHIGLATTDPSFSFYSLAYEPLQQRAAVTLHWVLNQADYGVLNDLLTALPVPTTPPGAPVANNLSDLIATMGASPPAAGGFQGTPILNALQNWLTPSP